MQRASKTHNDTSEVIFVLLHQTVKLHENVVTLLPQWSEIEMLFKVWNSTLAVVLPHVTKARAAASIASFVSSRPMSGTVPSFSPVAGSNWQ